MNTYTVVGGENPGGGVLFQPTTDVPQSKLKKYPEELLRHRKLHGSFVLEDFEIKKQLGAGSFGSVYLAKELRSGKNVVIKTLSKASILEWNMIRQLQREIEIQCRLRHPNITRLYAYFHTDEHCLLVLQYASLGSLWSKLQTVRYLQEPEAAQIFRQVMSGVAYLHQRNIIHRDLKPENILLALDDQGREVAQITDFGWAIVHRQNATRTTLCGTVEYLPPEVCKIHLEKMDNDASQMDAKKAQNPPESYPTQSSASVPSNHLCDTAGQPLHSRIHNNPSAGVMGCSNDAVLAKECGGIGTAPSTVDDGRYDHRFDIYTAGALLFEMLIGHSPFAGPEYANDPDAMTSQAIMERIKAGRFRIPASRRLSMEVTTLIRRMMMTNPKDRPSAIEVLHHPWVVKYVGTTDPAEYM